MIWLTWRQQRTETLIAALAFAIVMSVLVPTGLHIASVYHEQAIGACLTHPAGACRDTISEFSGRWDSLVNVVGWFNLLPVMVGALLAAPLVLEFERGTYRLVWTQSVTRGRWLTARLALIGAAALLSALLLTALMTWWRQPLDDVGSRMPDGFDLEGLAPSVYTLFAAALVIAIGVVLRRTAAAIGLAVVAFFVIRLSLGIWGRQHYEAPIHKTCVSHGITSPSTDTPCFSPAIASGSSRASRRASSGRSPSPSSGSRSGGSASGSTEHLRRRRRVFELGSMPRIWPLQLRFDQRH